HVAAAVAPAGADRLARSTGRVARRPRCRGGGGPHRAAGHAGRASQSACVAVRGRLSPATSDRLSESLPAMYGIDCILTAERLPLTLRGECPCAFRTAVARRLGR